MLGSTRPAAALVALGLAIGTTSAAAPKAPTQSAGPRGAAKLAGITASGAAGQATNAAAVTALHQVEALLASAIHDYDGHRAKAAHLVRQAIHELHPHHATGTKTGQGKNNVPAKGNKPNNNGNNGNANQQTQAQSDAKLQQAMQALNTIQGQLAHAPKAAAHVQTAVKELTTALQIK
jgi:hypothetical protein